MTLIPDLILTNGFIVTMNKEKPRVESIAIKDGKIIAVGTNEEITKFFSQTKEVIDLGGKFACPGFIDSHTHLLSVATKFNDVILDEVLSPNEAIEKIHKRAINTSKGTWIFGEAWDESNWDEKRYLTLDDLDKVAPEHPCFIRRVCGHLIVINSLALKELGIPFDDPDLEINTETGKPTGILYDEMINRLANNPLLHKSQQDFDEAVKLACKYANSLGVTSIADNLNIMCVKSYMKAWRKHELTIRVNLNIPMSSFENYLATGLKSGFGDSFLRLGGIKIFTDGSLGSRTAALSEVYYDDPSADGEFYIQKEDFIELINIAIQNDWQTVTHAIGDRAIEFVITAFESINNPDVITKGRHRIEHAEYLTSEQLKRVNKLGLVLSMQPNFPGRWGKPGQLYENRLGSERYTLLNNFRKILDSNAKVCFGSDNMPMSPLFGIWSVVTHPINDIRIAIEEALYHYTLGAAYSSFEEDIKGSIEVGKLADIVVLDKNLFEIDVDVIKDVHVSKTIIDGKIVYQK